MFVCLCLSFAAARRVASCVIPLDQVCLCTATPDLNRLSAFYLGHGALFPGRRDSDGSILIWTEGGLVCKFLAHCSIFVIDFNYKLLQHGTERLFTSTHTLLNTRLYTEKIIQFEIGGCVMKG